MEIVIAALPTELHAIRKRKAKLCVETGIGAQNSASVLRTFIARQPVNMVWNIGFAGALTPSLKAGDLVIDRELNRSAEGLLRRAEALQNEGFPVYFGRSVPSLKIVCKAAEKSAMLSHASVAWVDMESSAVAAICAEHNIPLFTIRCISDLFDEDLPLDLNRCFDSTGRLGVLLLLKEVLPHPSSLIGLIELYKRSRLCSEQLARFLMRLTSSSSL